MAKRKYPNELYRLSSMVDGFVYGSSVYDGLRIRWVSCRTAPVLPYELGIRHYGAIESRDDAWLDVINARTALDELFARHEVKAFVEWGKKKWGYDYLPEPVALPLNLFDANGTVTAPSWVPPETDASDCVCVDEAEGHGLGFEIEGYFDVSGLIPRRLRSSPEPKLRYTDELGRDYNRAVTEEDFGGMEALCRYLLRQLPGAEQTFIPGP